jgi:hypothetical protein
LSVLRELTSKEAEAFRVMCTLAMSDGIIASLQEGPNPALEPYSITFGSLLQLRDAGLLLSGENLSVTRTVDPNRDPQYPESHFLMNNGVTIQLFIPAGVQTRYPVLVFSAAGHELQKLMAANPNEEYLRALGAFWRSRSINAKRGTDLLQGGQVIGQSFEQDL